MAPVSIEREAPTGSDALSLENQSRHVMSKLVHDVTAEAFRLNLYGAPAGHVATANGAPRKVRHEVKNG